MTTQGPRFLLRQLEENPVALRQVKTTDKEYLSLKDAIAKEGVILPISVTPLTTGDGKSPKVNDQGEQMYRIIDGLHRFTASKALGLSDIPVAVTSADDARIERLQLMANAQRVKTKPSDFAKYLNRIIARDPTKTTNELGAELGFGGDWIEKILSINEIQNEDTRKLVNEGKISVSNAADLAKLPADEQDSFVKDALNDVASIFGPKVNARIKQIREERRKGMKPGQAAAFTYEPRLRTKVEVLHEIDSNGSTLEALLRGAGCSTPLDGALFALKWATSQDAPTVEAAKAKFEQRQAEREAEKAKLKAERDAQRAKESAAAAASATT